MSRQLVIITFIFVCCVKGTAQTIFARSNGDWDQTAVWSTIGTGGATCGCVPSPGDDVRIDGYDVDIDAGTGDVTVNSVIITNARGVDVRIRVQAGATLTVTTNFEIENNFGGSDSELTVEGTGSGLDVLGNFIGNQITGDDVLIDIDNNSEVNIFGDATFFQDGGDDFELNLNLNAGTQAQWNVSGDFLFDHDGGDDIRVLIDDAASLLTIGGDLTVAMNTGADDDFSFNLDDGDLIVTGSVLLTRANDVGPIDFDMDGGDVTCGDVVINSSGPLFSLGAIHFFVDEASVFNCDAFSLNMTGGDDFFLHINQAAGTTARFNVAADMAISRSSGDDIEIMVSQSAELNIGGAFSLLTSGLTAEELEIRLRNNAVVDIAGDCALSIVNGEDVATNLHLIELAGGGANPLFHVGGDFSWTSSIDIVDNDLTINGGEFAVDGNMTLVQNAGAEDFDFFIDDIGSITVGGNLSVTLNGGDDFTFSLGANLAASTAECHVLGNCTLTHNNNSASSTFLHQVREDSRFTVDGVLTLTTNFAASPTFIQDIRNTAEVSVSGDVNLNATASGELEIDLQNDAFFRIGGDFVRAAVPNRFGSLIASDNATVEFRGTSAQIIAEDTGSGGDSFFYMNLEVDNSFATAP